MSNTRHVRHPGTPPAPQIPAIFVNATQIEVHQLNATHVGLIISNSVVSAQMPLDALQLRQLSANLLEASNTIVAVPSKPALILP